MYKLLILILLLTGNLYTQNHQQGIDTVYSFKPGTGQNSGQEAAYYPGNIFGMPDTNARDNFQSADPSQILSIGLGGEITVGFKNFLVVDGPGADFTIFENAFINPITNKIFAEPAKVSVSQDGINFIEFPYDLKTLKGCAGKTPTNGNRNPFDTLVSGGDKFDIAALGLDRIKYIKITDICRELLNDPTNQYYDPIISGFDLDAVIGLNLIEEKNTAGIDITAIKHLNYSLRDNVLEIINQENSQLKLELYDYIGNLIEQRQVESNGITNLFLNKGLFFLLIKSMNFNEIQIINNY